jgi:hypothetical protein
MPVSPASEPEKIVVDGSGLETAVCDSGPDHDEEQVKISDGVSMAGCSEEPATMTVEPSTRAESQVFGLSVLDSPDGEPAGCEERGEGCRDSEPVEEAKGEAVERRGWIARSLRCFGFCRQKVLREAS